MRSRLILAALSVLAASPTFAASHDFEPPFVMPKPPMVEPDAPLAPTPGGPRPDLAFGAYQRGYFITALREALKRVGADPGDAAAMTLIGEIYRDGIAVRQNMVEAEHWFQLASKAGDPAAAFELGVILLDGAPGIARDRKGAEAQFAKAAVAGHATALYNLGVLAIDVENGAKPDFVKAASYFKRAAEAGDGNAAYSYGVQLRDGKGVPLDIGESAHWLKVASDEGIIAGQVEYAIMLFNGVGVTRDEAAAARIFLLAAARRNPIAANRLAHLYVSGRGVPKDLVLAALWNGMAKAAGLDDEKLDKAIGQLSPDDQAKVNKLTQLELEF